MDHPLLPGWIALAVGLFATPIVRAVSIRRGWVERPGVRRVHSRALPRTGGLAVALAAAVALVVADRLGVGLDGRVVTLLACSLPVFLVGWIDDVRGAGPKAKLLAQTGAGVLLCAAGVRLDAFPLPGGGALELGVFAAPLTVAWLVTVSNALNLIDGSDGIAATLTIVAGAAIAAVALLAGDPATAAAAAALVGAAAAFLAFNAHPATIHLGDGGSLGLGFALGGLLVVGAGREGAPFAAAAAPALALAIPLADLAVCVVRRRLVGRSIVAPDTAHLHHSLLGRGLSPRAVALLLGGVAATSSSLGVAELATPGRPGLLALAGLAVTALLFVRVAPLRPGPLLAAHRRRRAIERLHRDLRKQLEHLQLVLWNTSDADAWWETVERAARSLGLSTVVAQVTPRAGAPYELRWARGGDETPPVVTATLAPRPPAGVTAVALRCAIADGPIETAAERLSCFARLLEGERPDWAARPVDPIPHPNPNPDGRRPLRPFARWGPEALERGPFRDP